MKKFYTLLSTLFIFTGITFAQIGYSPQVQDIIDEITESSVSTLDRELSGDLETTVGGSPYTIASRHYQQPGNAMAAQWIFEKLESYGYTPVYQDFGSNGTNVIATKTGTDFPDKQYIICGHYDAMPSGPLAPGADDNASGTVATIEAARVLADYDLPYTIKFIAWDEEEIGLIGSAYYANQAAANGDDILGVINLDMIGWDSNDDFELSIATNALSSELTNDYEDAMAIYAPLLNANYISTTASDHASFWNNGYPAILAIEDMGDFHQYYHTTNDKFEHINVPYFHTMTQAAVSALASLAWDFKMDFVHSPLPSGNFTEDRTAVVSINSFHDIAGADNSPRLYYKINDEDFIGIESFYANQDTFKFNIPAQTMGTDVYYYFAAQDEEEQFICTYPAGGRGMNPPGTEAPGEFFHYTIADIENSIACSESLPKPIEDFTYLYDTIHVPYEGTLIDLNVEITAQHTYDGDISIYLMAPNGTQIALSTGNGGSGDGYINTVFDDEAESSIASGSAPFSGHYQPEGSLSSLDGSSISGDWILIIYDNGPNDEGSLDEYCLHLQYDGEPVAIAEQKTSNLILRQNFPNPASDNTTISLKIDQKDNIRIDIFDIYGRLVKTAFKGTVNKGDHLFTVDVSDMPAGQYVYRIQSNRGSQAKTFLVIN